MKLLRLSDDHFVLSFGSDIHREFVEQISEEWKRWWTSGHPGVPLVLGGEKLEYEDRRKPESQLDDIQKKLDLLLDMLS